MSGKIRIAVCGFGNVGRGVLNSLKYNEDVKLSCVITRRNPNDLDLKGTKVVNEKDFFSDVKRWQSKIDVVILCGGSHKDIPVQGPLFAKYFNTVDSFDTHANIYTYYLKMDKISKKSGKTSLVSAGWDPGIFSINRLYANSILPQGTTSTFWGEGVSQGHSDAIRKIDGVKKAIQYTIPIQEAIDKALSGDGLNLTARQKHKRVCYVVLNDNGNEEEVENKIKNMPNYFLDYDTVVNFITDGEFDKKHVNMPHGGFVIHTAKTSNDNNQVIEYKLKLDSNPEFTASVLVAYSRAVARLNDRRINGALSVFDIPPILLNRKKRGDLIDKLL